MWLPNFKLNHDLFQVVRMLFFSNEVMLREKWFYKAEKLACVSSRAGHRLRDLLHWNLLSFKKKGGKSSEAAALFHWQWCNAGDTPGREGPACSVTAQHVHGVTQECPTSQQIQPSANTSSRASFSSQYLYITAGSMFLEVTHHDCTCTISKTPPFAPPIFCALEGFRLFS